MLRCEKLASFIQKTNFCLPFIAAIYTQAYNQVIQQQQAAQLIASNPAIATASGLSGLGLLSLAAAAQKEGKFKRQILVSTFFGFCVLS